MPEPDSDRDLIVRFRAGDTTAFDSLVQRYMRRALATALRYTHRESDAQDMVQEAFLKAYTHFDQFDDSCSFSSWFFRILINHCLNWLKREKRRRVLFDSWRAGSELDFQQLEERISSGTRTPEQELIRQERQHTIWQALNKLPGKQRDAIILYDLENFSQQEIADILQCPVGSVMSRIYYGRQKLQKYLRDLLPPGAE